MVLVRYASGCGGTLEKSMAVVHQRPYHRRPVKKAGNHGRLCLGRDEERNGVDLEASRSSMRDSAPEACTSGHGAATSCPSRPP